MSASDPKRTLGRTIIELRVRRTECGCYSARERHGMALWREGLFAWMMKSSESAMEFFKLPTNRVDRAGQPTADLMSVFRAFTRIQKCRPAPERRPGALRCSEARGPRRTERRPLNVGQAQSTPLRAQG